MAPNCTFCQLAHASNDNTYHSWCGGNCFMDERDNTCKIIGKHEANLYLTISHCSLTRFIWQHSTYRFATLDDYIKVEQRNCISGKVYTKLNYAKSDCSADQRCIGVLAEHCEAGSTFYLCEEGITTDVTWFDSCVYKKKETAGKHFTIEKITHFLSLNCYYIS